MWNIRKIFSRGEKTQEIALVNGDGPLGEERLLLALEFVEKMGLEWDEVRRAVHRIDQRDYKRLKGNNESQGPEGFGGEPAVEATETRLSRLRAGDQVPPGLL